MMSSKSDEITNLNEIAVDEQKAFLEEKFNLNFPSTNFSARKNQDFNESRYSSLLTDQLYNWQYFSRGPHGFQPRPTWVMHDGPPFTTGKSHVGNMYNKVLKDAINRYKLLRGYRVDYVPGFDCFGSHTEDFFAFDHALTQKVDPQNLATKEDEIMSIRKSTQQGVKDSMLLQMEEFGKWGIMTDWRYSYFTMMPAY